MPEIMYLLFNIYLGAAKYWILPNTLAYNMHVTLNSSRVL